MSVLVGKPAPDFETAAVLADGSIVDKFSFSKETKGKYAVLVFYPLDFTFVCPTELIALDHRDSCKMPSARGGTGVKFLQEVLEANRQVGLCIIVAHRSTKAESARSNIR